MTIESLTTNLQGDLVLPETQEDWSQWVSASRTRNHVLGNPLIDWLELYGVDKGYQQDQVDDRADFVGVLLNQGQIFEQHVLKYFQSVAQVETIGTGDYASRYDLSTSEATYHAMERGVDIIYQGTLRDAESKTYGSPDFLFRSDMVNKYFENTLDQDKSFAPAPDLINAKWHYIVVDSKFATLDLLSKTGHLGNSGSLLAYKVQVYLYNRILGRLQGYTPSESFLLGRGWNQRIAGESHSSRNSMDKLGPVSCDINAVEGQNIAELAESAVGWLRRLRKEGKTWRAEPEPTVNELRVNARGEAGYWSDAVKSILKTTEDLTMLHQVGVSKRNRANESGFTRWSDSLLTPADVGVNGDKVKRQLAAFLEVNKIDGSDRILPQFINTERSVWHPKPPLEFFVDFETVNSSNDNFESFPNQGSQGLIFMIGCGHIENDEWKFECFITTRLNEEEEARIIDEWFAHMEKVQDRLDPGNKANVYHWSPAEVTFLQTGSTSAFNRHPQNHWPIPNWFDFYGRVMTQEPVVVRGAHGFGLKAIAKALNELEAIQLAWPDGTADGLGAMAGAWWCDERASLEEKTLIDYALMDDIRDYNEIDCKAMWEIISYFRFNH